MPKTEGMVWDEACDRKSGRLMVYGLSQVGLGVLAVLIAVRIGFSVAMISTLGVDAKVQTIPKVDQVPEYSIFVLDFAALGVLLMTLGVGSILARRWARTLSLALWTALLAYGVARSLYWVFLLALIIQGVVTGATQLQLFDIDSPDVMPPSMIFLKVVAAVMISGASLAFVLFYRRRDVKATCDWRNPKPHWTDSRPIPMLVASFLMLFMVTSTIQQGATNSFYIGVSLVGAAGYIGAVLTAGILLAAAIGLLKMWPWGWWIAVVATTFEAVVWLFAAVMGKVDMFNVSTYRLIIDVTSEAGAEYVAQLLWARAVGYVFLATCLLWLGCYSRRAPADCSGVIEHANY